jgi:aromatic ring-cleaving dioxygenase
VRSPSGCRAVVRDKFQVEFGGFRDEPVGPHPVANAQVIFKPEQFQPVVEWLMLHRDGLLKLNTLRPSHRAGLLPSA